LILIKAFPANDSLDPEFLHDAEYLLMIDTKSVQTQQLRLNSPVSVSPVAKLIDVANFFFRFFIFVRFVLPGKIPVVAASGDPQILTQVLDAMTITQLIYHLKL
jgi:hypothetical protein